MLLGLLKAGVMMQIKPFVKWVGGKRRLIEILKASMPPNYNRYIEPFAGGGALLFELKPKRFLISDTNWDLICCYKVIQRDIGPLLALLAEMPNDEQFFYSVRNWDREDWWPRAKELQRASRLIYLNRTCFNGLYRENKAGQFNAGFGFYSNPQISDDGTLLALHTYLKTNRKEMVIRCQNYTDTLRQARAGDFVYLDPPYHKTYNAYRADRFGDQSHLELAAQVEMLSRKGVFVMLSNSDTEFIRNTYRGFHTQEIMAPRSVSCKGDSRKDARELLITNYLPRNLT